MRPALLLFAASPPGDLAMPIRCPACSAENSDQARVCSSCGVKLPRKSRRRQTEEPPPATGWGPFAFRVSVWSLIPLVGAIMGPIAVLIGLLAYRPGLSDEGTTGNGQALAAIIMGGLVMVTNWVGVALMVYGLSVAGVL